MITLYRATLPPVLPFWQTSTPSRNFPATCLARINVIGAPLWLIRRCCKILMLHFFGKRDRWGNGLALWVVVGMVFLVPLAIWSLFSMKMENEVQDWIPKDNPDYRIVDWYRHHFPLDDMILLTWDGSSLQDTRVDHLVQKIRGKTDSTGRRRGGSKLIERVRTPQELVGQMQKNKASRDEAVERLEGVLVGSGPLRIRFSEFGRARRDK